jgi:hypothetical protein
MALVAGADAGKTGAGWWKVGAFVVKLAPSADTRNAPEKAMAKNVRMMDGAGDLL